MSVVKTIPRDSRFIQSITRFTGWFNTPALGKYQFNSRQTVLAPLSKTSIYLIDRFGFSAIVPESDFFQSINVVPTFQLLRSADNFVIFPKPLPLISYCVNSACAAFFWTASENDTLVADFRGLLDQVPALVGIDPIIAQVTLDIYEILDSQWVNEFKTGRGL